MDIRRAYVEDFAQIVRLQDANLNANLADDEKTDGFLSQQFTAAQFAQFDESVCVVVAWDDGKLGGFLCASTFEHNLGSPLVKVMYERLPEIQLNGRPISAYSPCLVGPICIDKEWRGKGVLPQLYNHVFGEIVSSGYDLILIFVSEQNPRSIKAHEKLGFSTADRFEYAGNRYQTMSKALSGT